MELTNRERRTAEAMAGMVDVTPEQLGVELVVALERLAQRAWMLRARVVDARDVSPTFIISGEALRLFVENHVDIGAGPVFEATTLREGAGGVPYVAEARLFGIRCIHDEPGSRHERVQLVLDGSELDPTPEPVDMSKVLGVESIDDEASEGVGPSER